MNREEYRKEYYRMNRELLRVKQKERYAKNKETNKNSHDEEYYDKANERAKIYYQNNKDKIKAYKEKNKQKIKDQQHVLYLKRKGLSKCETEIPEYITDSEIECDIDLGIDIDLEIDFD